jgi:hypothetical protein
MNPGVIEALLFIVIGVVLAIVLPRLMGRGESSATRADLPGVKIVRTARTPEGHEETWLVVNDQVILAANNDGLRLADYADEVEQLEAVAARLARAMGIAVEFSRRGAGAPGPGEGIPVRSLPATSDEDADARNTTRRAKSDQGGA